MQKMKSLRASGVDATKKAGILVPLVDIEASFKLIKSLALKPEASDSNAKARIRIPNVLDNI